MANQIKHPSLSQLLPLEKIPNEIEAVRDALSSIFDDVFVKNLFIFYYLSHSPPFSLHQLHLKQ